MKLFGLFVAAAAASKLENDRVYSDNPAFINKEVPEWWNKWPKVPADKAQEIRDATNVYFDTFVPTATSNRHQLRVADIMKRHLLKTMNMNEKIAEKARCGGNSRKRRDVDRGFELNVNQGSKQAIEDLFWQYANWSRNELQAGCPEHAQRMLKRLDRLRLIWLWQTCNKEIDPTGPHCSWISETNPRFSNTKFNRDNNTPFTVLGCQGAKAELSCPYGGKINIISAAFGRRNNWECAGKHDSPNGNLDKCWGKDKIELTASAEYGCEGKDSCSFFSYEPPSQCPDTDKYYRVQYTCDE